MAEEINEMVKVRAEFEKGRLTPLFFSWRGREYRVAGVDFTHEQKDGTFKVCYFSLTGGGNRYWLSFNTRTFIWRVEGAEIQ